MMGILYEFSSLMQWRNRHDFVLKVEILRHWGRYLSEMFASIHDYLLCWFSPVVMKLRSFFEDPCYHFYGELVVVQTRNFLVCVVSLVLWFKFIHVNVIFWILYEWEVSCNSHIYLSHYASLTVQLFFTYLFGILPSTSKRPQT